MKTPETVNFNKIFGNLYKKVEKTEKEKAKEWMRIKYGWQPVPPKKKDS